jgi:hypothetical protein
MLFALALIGYMFSQIVAIVSGATATECMREGDRMNAVRFIIWAVILQGLAAGNLYFVYSELT